MGLIRDIQKAKRIGDAGRPKDLKQLQANDLRDMQDYANEQSPVKPYTSNSRVKSTTTEGRLYLIALSTLDRLDIQYVPDEISVKRIPTIASIQIIGRNNPIYHYISGETILNLQLDFHSMEENRQDVIDKCRWLEHLAYADGNKKEPQKVMLVYGDLFTNSQWIVKNVNYTLSQFNKQKGFLPQQAYVDIELAADPDFNIEWDDIRSDNNNPHLGTR